MWKQFAIAAHGIGNMPGVVKYATLSLKEEKYVVPVLRLLLIILADPRSSATTDETFELLSKIYDFREVKDKMFVAKCAQELEQTELAYLVVHAGEEVVA
jgi:hypothetical protein